MGEPLPLVLVLGAGLMGVPIGCEYALGGYDVTLVARDLDRVRRRIDDSLRAARELAGFRPEHISAARERISVSTRVDTGPSAALIVESLPEDATLKADALRSALAAHPDAVVASNTSSVSITELARAAGADDRLVGTHYWNPPMLMPLVEVIAGNMTPESLIEETVTRLRGLGKSPVLVRRDVPGFVWNRLQFALLREAVALVADGVTSAESVDEIVRCGLARRWCSTGPFETVALGGVATFASIADNLWPALSDLSASGSLADCVDHRGLEEAQLEHLRTERDAALAEHLRRDKLRWENNARSS
ncbi:MAG: 3-hydroxyacyl-CoA dehydrogenase family protein [Dehalococcoidia bacterium]